MVKDMTVGNPTKLILAFSVPLLIGNLFQQFYNMVDTIIVGRFIGVEALAALGSTGSLNFLVMGFIMGITSGFSVLIAQSFGANDEDKLRHYVAVSTYLCIIFAIAITIIMLLSVKQILAIMKTPNDIFDEAYSYIRIVFAGATATIAYNMLSGILRSLGDSKTPLYFLIISSILNIILDVVFIVNFNMGVEGAAYATVISQGVSAILCFIYIKKKFKILRLSKKDLKFDLNTSNELLKLGVPMALQFSITASGAMILQGAINSFGSAIVAAQTAAAKVEQILMQPALTLGTTMSTYTGQNLGAKKYDRIQDGIKKSIIISITINIIAGIIIILFGTNIAKLFISGAKPEVINSSKQYLDTVAFFFIPLGLLFIYRNVLQGMGEGMMTMYVGISELIARFIVGFVLSKYLGYTAICLAGPAAWISAAVLLMFFYYRKLKSFNKIEYIKYIEVND